MAEVGVGESWRRGAAVAGAEVGLSDGGWAGEGTRIGGVGLAKAGVELPEVVPQAHQGPLCADVLESAHGKAPELLVLFDAGEYGFDDGLARA